MSLFWLTLCLATTQAEGFSKPKVEVPDPYLGYAIAPSKTKGNGSGKQDHQMMMRFGIPFTFNRYNLLGYTPLKIRALPELSLHPEYYAVFLGLGPEQRFSLGGGDSIDFVWGFQAGFHYAYLVDKKNYLNDDGDAPLREWDRHTLALGTNLYVGPKFDFTKHMSLLLQGTSQVSVGKIAGHTIRWEYSNAIGWTVGFNAQLQFEF